MKLKINGKEITTNGKFAFDGCHKFYIIEDAGDEAEARDLDYHLYAIAELADKWAGACPLKFIYNWKLTNQIVEQFAEEGDGDGVYTPTEIEVRG